MKRFWLDSYPDNVPHDINISLFASVPDVMSQAASQFPNNAAFSNFGKTISFSELDKQSLSFAAYCQNEMKLKKGDKIAIMLPNILQYPVALFGALRAGLVVVNVNPMYTPRELHHQLNDSGAKALVFLENFADVVEKVLDKTKVKHLVRTQIGDLLSFPKSVLINSVLKYVKKMVPVHGLHSAPTFKQALEKGNVSDFKNVDLSHDDIAFLQYTGGTTGVSKGVILTHGNMLANMLQSSTWVGKTIVPGQERIITALPLYHIFSLTANCLFLMCRGGENILITNPRDFKGFIKILQKERFSAITGLNTLFRKMLDTPGFEKIDFSGVKVTFAGGMAVSQDVADDWKRITGCTVVEAYGLTETSPAVCINPLDLAEFNGMVGLPISSTYVKIIDDKGADLGIDEAGELCIKGPQVTQGYWNLPELKETIFTEDGYLRTGDVATINAQGYVKLLDRIKDMILVSGFNVYPTEIDDVLTQHSGIAEAATIGIDCKEAGQKVKVFIVKSDPSLTEADVLDHCKENLTAYKRPKLIEFIDELPKSNIGKILRKDLS